MAVGASGVEVFGIRNSLDRSALEVSSRLA